MSAPAENALSPSPRMTATRTSSLAFTSEAKVRIARHIAVETALRRAGLRSRSVATPPAISTAISPPWLISSRRLVREPTARLRCREQLGERGIDRRRLLAVDGVARTRHHQKGRRRHRALEEDAAVETEIVLIADDHQERHRELPEFGFHLPQRRALELKIEHGVGMAFGCM